MTDDLSARDELYEIAELLRDADEREKEAKKTKDSIRGQFLELISEVVRDEVPLARQTEKVTHTEAERFGHDLYAWQRQNFPEWRVVAIDPAKDHYKVVLEENEDFKKFEFVHDGFKYGRTIAMTGRSFLAEDFLAYLDELAEQSRLIEETLTLINAMRACVKKEVVVTYDFLESSAIALMADKPETVAIFQKFLNPGTPQARLLPIKVAKEQEE